MMHLYMSGVKVLKRLKSYQTSLIKDELTFPNPQYENAKKHSSFGTGNIPPYIQYYTEGKEGIIVPRGYNIPYPYDLKEDKRIINNVEYPPLHLELRETQKEAVESFIHHYMKSKDEHGVLVLPPGKGKSILGLYLARKFSQRALIIVNKDDLVDGWTKDAYVLYGIKPLEVGLIKGKIFRLGEHLTITTIQTLSTLPPEKIKKLHETFGMVICDEVHNSPAKMYDLISYFPARFKIGLTATPLRNDGLQEVINLYFGNLVYEYADKADDEDILPVNVLIRNAKTEFNPEREFKYNYKKKRPEPVQIPISTIRKATSFDDSFNTMLAKDIINEYEKGKSCIVFTHEKEHCRFIQERLIERGVPEERIQLYYGDSKLPKSEMKRRAESREVLITIATYAIATEGTNVTPWERGFLASTIANEKSVVQAIGRVRRTTKGKEDCLVYDYRFPNVIIANNHGKIRDKVYKNRGYNVIGREEIKRRKTGRGFDLFRREK